MSYTTPRTTLPLSSITVRRCIWDTCHLIVFAMVSQHYSLCGGHAGGRPECTGSSFSRLLIYNLL